jgi:Nif-specific regulatory protein
LLTLAPCHPFPELPVAARRSHPDIPSEVQELSLLFEISQLLDQSLDLHDVLQPVLKAMAKHLGMLHGIIALLNRETERVQIEAAYGLSKRERERGRYKLGEGLTGRVVQSGRPAIVPRVSDEPTFLNRTGALRGIRKEDVSFICVPIKLGRQTIGALSVNRLFDADVPLGKDVRSLSIIASMIAQAVHLRRSAEEERERLVEENLRLQEQLQDRFSPDNIVGNSSPMQAVYDQIAKVSGSDTTVLIRGESGTGKELVASAIHYNSPRAGGPFVRFNCAALPENILESELFGHEEGAFTGATRQRKGRFELASGGTIFLDEIGDLTASSQIRLLRVLQEREFERVGGVEPIRVDVRVIAATNRNLEELVERGLFRQDLYYRLDVFPIHVPALRERRTDILLLADHFAEKYSGRIDKPIKRISTPAIDMMMRYHWPGNGRELENCIERAVLLSTDGVIHGHHLPPTLQTAEASNTVHTGRLQTELDNLERELIIDALKTARGNQTKAAQALGITERVMGLRVAKHGIDPRRFKTRR